MESIKLKKISFAIAIVLIANVRLSYGAPHTNPAAQSYAYPPAQGYAYPPAQGYDHPQQHLPPGYQAYPPQHPAIDHQFPGSYPLESQSGPNSYSPNNQIQHQGNSDYQTTQSSKTRPAAISHPTVDSFNDHSGAMNANQAAHAQGNAVGKKFDINKLTIGGLKHAAYAGLADYFGSRRDGGGIIQSFWKNVATVGKKLGISKK